MLCENNRIEGICSDRASSTTAAADAVTHSEHVHYSAASQCSGAVSTAAVVRDREVAGAGQGDRVEVRLPRS